MTSRRSRLGLRAAIVAVAAVLASTLAPSSHESSQPHAAAVVAAKAPHIAKAGAATSAALTDAVRPAAALETPAAPEPVARMYAGDLHATGDPRGPPHI